MENKTACFTCPSLGKLNLMIPSKASVVVKLIFWGSGSTMTLAGGKHVAGEIMFEFPDRLVCHADSFFIGRPVLALGIDDQLRSGETYFVIPIDRLPCNKLSASSLATLNPNPSPSKPSIHFGGQCPFEYVKGDDGGILIKVVPQFLIKLMLGNSSCSGNSESRDKNNGSSGDFLCSTPELKKHYEQLVGSRDQGWSPKLETISEHKNKITRLRLLGLEWKLKQNSIK